MPARTGGASVLVVVVWPPSPPQALIDNARKSAVAAAARVIGDEAVLRDQRQARVLPGVQAAGQRVGLASRGA
jgi:hypothetical protein